VRVNLPEKPKQEVALQGSRSSTRRRKFPKQGAVKNAHRESVGAGLGRAAKNGGVDAMQVDARGAAVDLCVRPPRQHRATAVPMGTTHTRHRHGGALSIEDVANLVRCTYVIY